MSKEWDKFREIVKILDDDIKVEMTAEIPLGEGEAEGEGLNVITDKGRIFINKEGEVFKNELGVKLSKN